MNSKKQNLNSIMKKIFNYSTRVMNNLNEIPRQNKSFNSKGNLSQRNFKSKTQKQIHIHHHYHKCNHLESKQANNESKNNYGFNMEDVFDL